MDKAKLMDSIIEVGEKVLNDQCKMSEISTRIKDKLDDTKALGDEDPFCKVLLLMSYVRDSLTGTYKEKTKLAITIAVGTLAYLVFPLDFIPDWIPVLGYVDDSLVMATGVGRLAAELIVYVAWKKETPPTGTPMDEFVDKTVGNDPEARSEEIDRLADVYNAIYGKDGSLKS